MTNCQTPMMKGNDSLLPIANLTWDKKLQAFSARRYHYRSLATPHNITNTP
jgi:hypothetical protein